MQKSDNEEIGIKKLREHLFFMLFINILALGIETILFVWMFNFDLPLIDIFILHLGVVLFFLGVSYIYYLLRWDTRIILFSSFSIAFLGAFGAFLNVLVIPLYRFFDKKRIDNEEFYKALLPEEEYTLSQEIFDRVEYGMDKFEPEKLPTAFLDVLTYGTEKQKRIAIDRILRHFRPEFSESLQKALNDQSNSIRVLAATAVMRIDDQYSKKYYEIEKAVSKKNANKRQLLELAKHCEDYATLSFVDEDIKKKMLQRAFQAYEMHHKAFPQETLSMIAKCRLHYISGEYQDVITTIGAFIEQDAILSDEAYLWYFSALFKMEEYARIREVTEKNSLFVATDSIEHDEIIDLIILWKRGLAFEKKPSGELYEGS